MVKIQNYDPYETDIKFDVEEGDVTVKTGFADFGKDDVLFFSKEVKKGDYVALDTTSTVSYTHLTLPTILLV